MDEPTSVEHWLPIPGFSGYLVSDAGRVWSLPKVTGNRWGTQTRRPGKVLRSFPARDGYPQVQLVRDDGQHVSVKLHRLVLTVFVGLCPPGMEACHEDDDHTNAALSNLRWGTRSDNWSDRRRNGRQRTGKTHLELSEQRRRVLRDVLSDGCSS